MLFDLETAPSIGAYWEPHDTNIIWTEQYGYLLAFAYQWFGEKKIRSYSLPDFKGYKPGSTDDLMLTKKLWGLLNEADVVIAHNAKGFDTKVANTRFIINGLPPPSPYKVIDTLEEARKYFKFESNKLNNLSSRLENEEKVDTGGFRLWKACMSGDPKAWKKMVKYNKKDIYLLANRYKDLRPWMKTHPNIGKTERSCPKCSGEDFVSYGIRRDAFGTYRRLSCRGCGGNLRERKNLFKPEIVNA